MNSEVLGDSRTEGPMQSQAKGRKSYVALTCEHTSRGRVWWKFLFRSPWNSNGKLRTGHICWMETKHSEMRSTLIIISKEFKERFILGEDWNYGRELWKRRKEQRSKIGSVLLFSAPCSFRQKRRWIEERIWRWIQFFPQQKTLGELLKWISPLSLPEASHVTHRQSQCSERIAGPPRVSITRVSVFYHDVIAKCILHADYSTCESNVRRKMQNGDICLSQRNKWMHCEGRRLPKH